MSTALIASVTALANISARFSKNGKNIGSRATFGLATASELRAHFKGEGLKGADITSAVNAALVEGSSKARVAGDTMLSAAKEAGFIFDYADVNAKGNAMVIRMVKPEAPKAIKPVASKDDVIALLKSMSAEDKAALLATLA
jgi:hypothetical protein